jgi:hypothetical protein
VARENGLHDLSLNADAATVDQPHLGESSGVCGVQVFGDDRGHVARRERVQIERVLDRDADRLVVERYSRGPPITCSFQ